MYTNVTEREYANSGYSRSLDSWDKGNAHHASRVASAEPPVDASQPGKAQFRQNLTNLQVRIDQLESNQIRCSGKADRAAIAPQQSEIMDPPQPEKGDRPIRQTGAHEKHSVRRSAEVPTRAWLNWDQQTRFDRFQQMRELAVVSARASLLKYESKQCVKLALDKLLVMIVGALSGLLLLHWSMTRGTHLAILPAIVAFFVVTVWGAQVGRAMGRLALIRFLLRRLD